ncbi:MAG: DUF2971 domain-containing protein [Sedimentisphaerales bacterium]|nr:DUF2971 domain-containing protein [Sedimentisphaerales bacterium]
MNILYKYCDQLGIVKILESLELKLPYISQVNDPLECLPFLYCPNDKSAMEARCLHAFKHSNISPPSDWQQTLNEQIKTGQFQKNLIAKLRKFQKDWNQRKGCLLSVSETAKEPVMWAHYADKHKGVVVGINFNKIFLNIGIKMHPVNYDTPRPKVNVLEYSEGKDLDKSIEITLMTKSGAWRYEEEFRTIFLVDRLKKLQRQGLAHLKDFKGKKTWFLQFNPESVREIIFGLYTDDSLKSAIRKLIERTELQHVKLYQAEESETYTLNLVCLSIALENTI